MLQKNYYQILGLHPSASEEEIKRAYRKLALEFHPDRHPDDPESEETCKEICEASAVLTDSENRGTYDRFGYSGFGRRDTREDILKGFNFEEIFREFGFGFEFQRFLRRQFFCGRRGRSCGRRGAMFVDIKSFREYGEDFSHGEETNQIYDLPLKPQEAFYGTQKEIVVETGAGQKRYSIQIPQGVGPNTRLRLTLEEFGQEEIHFRVKII